MSDEKTPPLAVEATAVPAHTGTNYPPPLKARVAGREKRKLGDHFGLRNFGVNHTTLAPGAASALLHRHAVQDELIYILEGHPTLRTEQGDVQLAPGLCAGFPAGGGAHQLVNRTDAPVVYLEIGDRSLGESVVYPEDDIAAHTTPEGGWVFTHKDGTPY
ncbi:MAG: cupin domain-containing protein [Alphaproteobacteria bacterium]|nr:cupin domain-containing protein [Alphaproteobacteria bacterium]